MLIIDLQPTYGARRAPRRARAITRLAIALAVGLPLLAFLHAKPGVLLVNPTPSEPPGVYVRAAAKPVQVGDLIAFPAPPMAYPYADLRMGYLHRTPILKAVAARAGDQVCTEGAVLRINGAVRAPILQRDRQGRTLPHWIGCRKLAGGEVLVFSDRVRSSFDSRYFGPVKVASAEIYRPLVTTDGLGR
jgi:conjugative transfer signal peptidase TraF